MRAEEIRKAALEIMKENTFEESINWVIEKYSIEGEKFQSKNKELTEENKGWLKACNNYAKLIQEVQETTESFRGKNKELIELTKKLNGLLNS